MPQSRELANKKNDHKDRQSRGPMGSAAGPKKGASAAEIAIERRCAHNWASRPQEGAIAAVDRNDPNYDSSEEN
ncbi:hypothetical protein GQ600_1408 [Phytophthora cactorum]|nr:hypothetical protein GQ600_1408 [Phytophthora cactorum]